MTTYKIRGLEKVTAALRSFPKAIVTQSLNKALAKGAAVFRDSARSRAPVDTGLMASDIIMAKDRKPGISGAQARYVVLVKYRGKDAAPYWRFVEFGTVKMQPQPFMRPAFDTSKAVALAEIIDSIASDVPRIAKQVST